MEDDLWWKMTFDGICPLLEDNLCWKTTFDDRHPFIWLKTTLSGRQPLMHKCLTIHAAGIVGKKNFLIIYALLVNYSLTYLPDSRQKQLKYWLNWTHFVDTTYIFLWTVFLALETLWLKTTLDRRRSLMEDDH